MFKHDRWTAFWLLGFLFVLSPSMVLQSPSMALAHPPGDASSDHSHAHDGDKAAAAGPTGLFTTRGPSRVLPPDGDSDAFHFVIYGDRTGGVPAGLKVLEQAVKDTNLIDPDLVMTVGDLIQGYNETPEWMQQMREYRDIMEGLNMPWYPVAGNHDVYWRGKGPAPQGHHEASYEKHFGPLWYSFHHKNAGFIVMYSDEGDPDTNQKDFNNGLLQRVSEAQMQFLDQALNKLRDADHVFVFLHHPRWIEQRYRGSNWDDVHQRLVKAGNVHGVFAGHIHQMHFGGVREGIGYYALATTGGHLSADIPGAGYLHHLNMVTVREDRFEVATIPVGGVMDPEKFTQEFHDAIDVARQVRQETQAGSSLVIGADGSISGQVQFKLTNDSTFPMQVQVSVDAAAGWMTPMDHQHQRLDVGQSLDTVVPMVHAGDGNWKIPELLTEIAVLAEDGSISLPTQRTPLPIRLQQVPADYFQSEQNQAIRITDAASAVQIPARDLQVPDGPMTLEAMVWAGSTSGNTGIVAKTQSSEYALFFDEGVPQFDIHLGGQYRTAKGRDKLSTDRWTHIAGVYDGAEVRFYVDGTLTQSVKASGSRRTNDLPLWIGADPDHIGQATRPFVGAIDEVRISSSARYTGANFKVPGRFEPDASTELLMHFDRALGPFHLDHSDKAIMAVGGRGTTLEPVSTP
ncbi:MAG: LamG-like jellyroll fold domain-containing protein [Planctomycetota bacterium]